MQLTTWKAPSLKWPVRCPVGCKAQLTQHPKLFIFPKSQAMRRAVGKDFFRKIFLCWCGHQVCMWLIRLWLCSYYYSYYTMRRPVSLIHETRRVQMKKLCNLHSVYSKACLCFPAISLSMYILCILRRYSDCCAVISLSVDVTLLCDIYSVGQPLGRGHSG